MGRRALGSLLLLVLFAFVACASGEQPEEAERTPPPTACQRGGGSVTEDRDASADVTRTRPGEYVYDVCGLGDTNVALGTQITERITGAGPVDTIEVTTNRNSNTRRFQVRWEDGHVVQLSNETSIGGSRQACSFDPPIELVRIPIRMQDLPKQTTGTGRCNQTIEVSVVGRDSIEDATGQAWATWVIDYETKSRGRSDQQRHWFSPELGHAVRIETTLESEGSLSQTAQLLRSYPH